MKHMFKALGILLLAATQLAVQAQEYPQRPVRILVGYPPGGSVDYIARLISQPLADALGQPVVIDNKAGADGTVAAAEVARSTPDGYTLLLVAVQQAINQHFYKTSYDTMKSFDYVSEIASAPMLLAVARSMPANSLNEFLVLAKNKPGGMTYGSTGAGSFQHLSAFILSQQGKFEALHVPYKGGGPMLTSAMSGEVDYVFTTLPLIVNQVKEGGRLKALAVSSRERAPLLPQVQAVSEVLPGFESGNWIGLVGPAGMPPAVRDKLSRTLARVLIQPQVKARLVADGWEAIGSSPDAFRAVMQSQIDYYGNLIRKHGIKAE